MEYKAIATAIKKIQDREVIGIASVTGNTDSGNDVIHVGSFTKTINERGGRVRHLWQHDMTMPPIATIKNMREVGRDDLPSELIAKYPDAEGGLEVTREYLDTPRGCEVLAGLKSGAINEMSIGFDPMRFDFEQRKTDDALGGDVIRHIREVRLWDTSDVNWGMNAATVAVKSSDVLLMQLYDAVCRELAARGAIALTLEGQ